MRRFPTALVQAATLALVFASFGCATIGTYETANTLGQGKLQFAIEPAYESFAGSGTTVSVPRIDFAGRYGVSDSVDIGARAGTSFIEFLTKFQLTDHAQKSVVLSLAPRVGGLVAGGEGSTGGLINVTLPFLIGIGVGEGSQLIIGPKLLNILVFSSSGGDSGTADILLAGTTLGYSAKLGDNFRLLPEFGIVFPIVGSARASSGGSSVSSTDLIGGGVIFQIGVGFLFGGA